MFIALGVFVHRFAVGGGDGFATFCTVFGYHVAFNCGIGAGEDVGGVSFEITSRMKDPQSCVVLMVML